MNKNTGKISPTTPSFYSNTSHVLVPTSASITFVGYAWDFVNYAYYVGHQRGADEYQRESGRVVCEAEQEQLDRDRESEPARVSAAAGRLSTPPGLTLKLADLRTGNKPGQPFAALDLHAGTEDHLQFPNREAPYRSGARQWAPPSYRWVRIGLDIHFTARSLSQKRRLSMTRTKNSQRAFAGLLLGGLFLMAQTASAQIWSSVGSACTPEDYTVSHKVYNFTNGTFQFAAGKFGSVRASCHVINPKNDGSSPLWNTLTIGGVDPGATSQVWAPLHCVEQRHWWESHRGESVQHRRPDSRFCYLRTCVGLHQFRLFRLHQRGPYGCQCESGDLGREAGPGIDRDRESEPTRVSANRRRLFDSARSGF